MRLLFWIAGTLLAANALVALLYFVLYLLTGEDGAKRRALRFYRWAALVLLTTINIAVFARVIASARELF